MKLVPQSEWSSMAGPHMDRNLPSAFIKLEVSMNSINLMRIALVVEHVKSTAQRLLFATPPLVCRVLTSHGPNTSRPT